MAPPGVLASAEPPETTAAVTDPEVAAAATAKAAAEASAATTGAEAVARADPATKATDYNHAATQHTSWTVPRVVAFPPAEVEHVALPPNGRPLFEGLSAAERLLSAGRQSSAGTLLSSLVDKAGALVASTEAAFVLDSAVPAEDSALAKASSSAVNAAPVTPALPEGWASRYDETKNATYYYNAATNETTWVLPSLALEASAHAKASPHVETAITITPTLLEGWTSCYDETKTATYYYNAATNETTWVFPSLAVEASAPAEASPPLETATTVTPALLEGSTSRYDETKNATYYYKAATNETNWALPSLTVEASAPAEASLLVETATTVTNTLLEGWTSCYDETKNATYYYNAATNETTWVPPSSAVEAPAPTEGPPPALNAVPVIHDLPEGWTSLFDETKSATYYYNAATNETTWVPPSSAVEAPAPAEASFLLAVKAVPVVVASALSEDWTSRYDETAVAGLEPEPITLAGSGLSIEASEESENPENCDV
jgi:hypothetical protein